MSPELQSEVFAAMDRRLDPASTAPVAVALSGGGDSLALLHLTMDWAKRHGRPVVALTVDHGLNPKSAGWTAEAGEKARGLGAAWRDLAWKGPKPTTGLQAKARTARHALLAEAARDAGAKVVLMGHTADDIAEGDLMRAADAPGLGRLREWGPSPAWPEGRGVFLLRPLLVSTRTKLRGYLVSKDAVWLDDPANQDRRFARIRAREILATAYPRGGADPSRTTTTSAQEKADGSAADETTAKTWVPASAGMSGEERVWFGAEGAEASKRLSSRSLAALLLSVSGAARPPRGPELQRLQGVIAAGGVATLSGCRVDARGDVIRVVRAAPRQGQPGRPAEPLAWSEHRFRAACGAYLEEAAIPPV